MSTESVQFYYSDTKENKLVAVFIAVLMASVDVFTILSNCVVFLALVKTLIKDGRQSGRGPSSSSNNCLIARMLMASMSMCGAAVGAIIMPVSLFRFISNRWNGLGITACAVVGYGDFMLCTVVLLHTIAIAIDTYLLIYKPFMYRLLTSTTGYVMIAICWSVTIIFISAMIFSHPELLQACFQKSNSCNINENLISMPFNVFMMMAYIILVALYFLVLKKVQRFKKGNFKIFNANFTEKIQTISAITQATDIFLEYSNMSLVRTITKDKPVTLKISRNATNNTVIKKKNSKSMKSFKFVGIILSTYPVFWFPALILNLLWTTCSTSVPNWSFMLLDWLAYCSFSANPLIYCWNKQIFRSVKALICKHQKHFS